MNVKKRLAIPPSNAAWVLLLIICVFALYVVVYNMNESPEAKAQYEDKQAIDICWDDYNKKSNSADMQVFVAKTCEMLEEKYRTQYGNAP